MYALTEYLRGFVRLEVTGAQPERFLNACAESGLQFRKTEICDPFTFRMEMRLRDLREAEKRLTRCQCTLRRLSEHGVPRLLRSLKRRWGLPVGALACCALLLWSSLHVWEIEVQDCASASETEILSALDRAGVRIGSYWPDFSNSQIQCTVLREVPELSWLAVNVSGSRAEVSLRERIAVPELYDADAPTEIRAAAAGLITELQVLEGEAAVRKGDTVLPGELLVSGEKVSSFEKAGTRSVHAKARVYARTWRTLSACTPLTRQEKRFSGRERVRLALELGKQRINLYNIADNSRNPDTKYDKLTRTYRLAIPGVFTTPLALIAERCCAYTEETVPADEGQLAAMLESRLTERLAQTVGEAGSVVSQTFSYEKRGGMLYVTLHAECLEDIAQERACVPAPQDNGEGETSQSYGQDHDH